MRASVGITDGAGTINRETQRTGQRSLLKAQAVSISPLLAHTTTTQRELPP